MGHIVEVAGTAIDNSEWMINKVVMEEYENLGDMSSAIMGADKIKDFGLQPLSSLMNKIKINLNKKMDLEELNRKVQVRLTKMIKLIKYVQKNVTTINNVPISITYKANGAPKRYQETIAPGITVKVLATYDPNAPDAPEVRVVRSTIEDMLKDYSPIEWHPYDTITVDTKLQTVAQ
jgi:hypothetical protein